MILAASAGLRHLALQKGRELWRGLAVLRALRRGSLVVGFVLVAVFAQVFRNWLLLRAVGVDASFFDAIAVLIAVVTLTQLPVGPTVGAAAAVLILGSDGVAAAAAAGLLLTVTGTVGGLSFAAWAGADQVWTVTLRGDAAAWSRQGSISQRTAAERAERGRWRGQGPKAVPLGLPEGSGIRGLCPCAVASHTDDPAKGEVVVWGSRRRPGGPASVGSRAYLSRSASTSAVSSSPVLLGARTSATISKSSPSSPRSTSSSSAWIANSSSWPG